MKKLILFLFLLNTLNAYSQSQDISESGKIQLQEVGKESTNQAPAKENYNSGVVIEESNDKFAGGDIQADQIKRYQQMRKKMMQRIFQDLGSDNGTADDGDDFFTNPIKRFEKLLGDSSQASSGIEFDWSESSEARILTIKSKDKKSPIEIKINSGMINISGKVEETNEYGTSVSSFTNAFSLPADVDATKVKIEQNNNGETVATFPFIIKNKPDQNSPAKPTRKRITVPGEVSI